MVRLKETIDVGSRFLSLRPERWIMEAGPGRTIKENRTFQTVSVLLECWSFVSSSCLQQTGITNCFWKGLMSSLSKDTRGLAGSFRENGKNQERGHNASISTASLQG